jgi:hypothetical protein
LNSNPLINMRKPKERESTRKKGRKRKTHHTLHCQLALLLAETAGIEGHIWQDEYGNDTDEHRDRTLDVEEPEREGKVSSERKKRGSR